MSTADVGIHGTEAIRKTLRYKALGGEVVTLIESMAANGLEIARITL